jgi:N-acetylglucosaminyldiphosphoundecaprenol N-acetyl-beta-D-mannosaminyltransferase
VVLHGVGFDPLTEAAVVNRVMTGLAAGEGGRIVTPNADILRLASRPGEPRDHVDAATLVLADGAPLVWASRLAGRPLPARVAGSDLIWSISGALAARRHSIYLLGGEQGAAERAGEVLVDRFPGLRVAGTACPPFGFDQQPDEYQDLCDTVVTARPDVVYVGLGFPKQERVIADLRPRLAGSWFMGCGAAIGFVAGTHRRAPRWMQRSGLEWLHRLGNEPGRLAKRYLLHDLPFAARLLVRSALNRIPRRG